jgi:ubiquinone/menaquinone biosynthesis C-methylase UbiE
MKVYGPASRWLRELIGEQLQRVPSDSIRRVLDVGCGEGTNTAMLAGIYPHGQVMGTDFSQSAIREADRKYHLPNLQFECDATGRRLDGAYDLITCFEVLEHVGDWESLLGRIARSSTNYVCLSTPTGRMRRFEEHVGHVRNFRKGQLETFLDAQGFAPVVLYYAGFPFYSPVYRDLTNLLDAGSSRFSAGRYGWKQKIVASILFLMFNRLSTRVRHGDQFVALFRRRLGP